MYWLDVLVLITIFICPAKQEELQPMDVTTNPPRFKMMLDHEVQELVFNWRIALTFSEAIKGKPYNIDNAFVDQEEGGTFFCLKPRNSHVMMQAGSKLHLEFFGRIKEALPTATYEFLPNTKECDGASTSEPPIEGSGTEPATPEPTDVPTTPTNKPPGKKCKGKKNKNKRNCKKRRSFKVNKLQ